MMGGRGGRVGMGTAEDADPSRDSRGRTFRVLLSHSDVSLRRNRSPSSEDAREKVDGDRVDEGLRARGIENGSAGNDFCDIYLVSPPIHRHKTHGGHFPQ